MLSKCWETALLFRKPPGPQIGASPVDARAISEAHCAPGHAGGAALSCASAPSPTALSPALAAAFIYIGAGKQPTAKSRRTNPGIKAHTTPSHSPCASPRVCMSAKFKLHKREGSTEADSLLSKGGIKY